MLKSAIAAAVAGIALLSALPAAAEVVVRHTDGFTLRFAVPVGAAPIDVAMAVEDIGDWWDDAHTYSGDAANMRILMEPGGCFCESMANGEPFEHGHVSAIDAWKVVLDAPLGPLKGHTTQADLTFSWPEAGTGTMVTMTFVVEGPGLGAMAEPVNGVMQTQFSRLVRYLE